MALGVTPCMLAKSALFSAQDKTAIDTFWYGISIALFDVSFKVWPKQSKAAYVLEDHSHRKDAFDTLKCC